MTFSFDQHSHRRFNPLNGEWVLCSPHRAKRPWLGQQEKAATESTPAYLPDCYLCPGNKRVGDTNVNPDYESTFVFPNDFPAVLADQPAHSDSESKFFKSTGVRGKCSVICFSPKHNLTMAQMQNEDIVKIINTWTSVYNQMQKEPFINYVQLFENKGAVMGCSNPHPHGQCWSTDNIPQEPHKELLQMTRYFIENSTCLLCDYLKEELALEKRIIYQNDSFVALVPFWAIWPFETLVLPKTHYTSLNDLDSNAVQLFADVLRVVTCRYDNMFNCSFPYSMGIHQSPTCNHPVDPLIFKNGKRMDSHLHVHFYPPLLRSATVKKFLVGYEMMCEPQRDLTAEQAAAKLLSLSSTHYTQDQ